MDLANNLAEHVMGMARQRSVVYEIWPEYLVVGNERRKVGFEVDFCGRLAREDEDWYRVYKDLREIVEYILRDETGGVFEILPFDAAIHEAPVRYLHPEVEVKILHRCGFDGSEDQGEERCLKNLEAKLHMLGIPKG